MGLPVLIVGASGTGKTASLRNFESNEIGIINILGKRLPFRKKFDDYVTTNYAKLKKALLNAKVNVLFVDDAGYLITAEFMRRIQEKGFDKFSELASNYYELIMFIQNELPDDKIVYLVMQEDDTEAGRIKPKTCGKLLDEKICIEGMFTIVFRSIKKDGKWYFKTQTDGYDMAKTPIGLFDDELVDNDLKKITQEIQKYYKGE